MNGYDLVKLQPKQIVETGDIMYGDLGLEMDYIFELLY